MPERDVIRKLAQFTPTPAGFDRDTLLFNAGRASVRRRWWLVPVVALLAITQAVTLVVLWPAGPPTLSPVAPEVSTPRSDGNEPSPIPANSLAQWNQYIRTDGELPPLANSLDLKPDHAPLTASSRGLGD